MQSYENVYKLEKHVSAEHSHISAQSLLFYLLESEEIPNSD